MSINVLCFYNSFVSYLEACMFLGISITYLDSFLESMDGFHEIYKPCKIVSEILCEHEFFWMKGS